LTSLLPLGGIIGEALIILGPNGISRAARLGPDSTSMFHLGYSLSLLRFLDLDDNKVNRNGIPSYVELVSNVRPL
jgi:hypothetical protein